jgi:hypothetical protein
MRKHPILRAIPGFRRMIKRAEQVDRERDKLQRDFAKLDEKHRASLDRIQLLEAQVAALQPSNGVEAKMESSNSFAAVGISADVLENPRFEKFPYAGPFPWLDQPDAGERVDAKLAAGLITANEATLCRLWSEKGYLILERAIELAVLDEVWAEYETAIAKGVVELKPESVNAEDPWPGRYLDVHLKVPGFCRILRHPSLLHWVELLMERVPAPFQTISSHKGSQQLPHSDSIHMTTYPIGYLSACWIAFEDIHPDSGPLVYYPGSHRLPYIFSQDVGIGEEDYRKSGSASYHEKYEPRIQEVLAQQEIQPQYFHARKGDVLFWHANLIHGGSPRRDVRHSRRALVNHYFVEGAICYHDLSASKPKPYSGTCIVEASN